MVEAEGASLYLTARVRQGVPLGSEHPFIHALQADRFAGGCRGITVRG